MSVEYRLITCLPKVFPVFSHFSFSSHCLLSAYVLFIVPSLGLSTFSCVYCFLPPRTLPLLTALFKNSRFLYWSTPSFSVSTVSAKNSSSFNMFSTSVIAFIKSLNCHHMKNNVRYKGNTNNTSVIILLISTLVIFYLLFYVLRKLNKTLSDGTLLGKTSRRFL